MKIAFISLGCAKNLVNTEQMMALVREAGYEITGDPEGADAAVLNTCGFIDAAKSEAIDHILELAQLKQQGKLGKLLVAGCLSQRYQDEICTELPEVDGVLGTGSYTEIVPALEELMDRDMGFACGLAGSVLRGRPRDAEEVVSDAFLALWEHAGQVEPGKLRPWLGRVVRNKALNRLRALGGELPLEEDWLALEPDRRPGPAEAVEQAERAELIRALLNGLPPQDRAIFLRHYYYGQTAADIGAALAMPPSTVKVRLHRGRKKLKELLMERGYSCACADD